MIGRPLRIKIAIGLWLCGALTQAFAENPAGSSDPKVQSSSKAPPLDQSKAFLRTSELKPEVSAPPRPAEIPAIPDRAIEPINASRKLIAEQRYTEAALELERALRYANQHPEIEALLAMLHWQAGNLERAKAHAALTVEKNPQSVVGHYILSRCLSAGSNRGDAIRELRIATLCVDFSVDAEMAALVHFHLAEMLAAEGFLSAAIEQYEAFGRAAEKAAPTPKGELASLLATRRGSVEQSKADMLERLGRFEEASEVLRPMAERTPEDVALQLRYARLLVSANKPQQAADALARLKTDNEDVLNLLLEIREKSGKPELVIEDLRIRLAINPDSAAMTSRLARLLIDQNRSDEAATLLGDYLTRHPDDATIRQAQLELLMRTRHWDEALRLAAIKLTKDPAQEREVESILSAVRQSKEAADAIVTAGGADSGDHVYLYLVGRVAVEAGRPDDALRILRASYAKSENFAPTRAALSELLVKSCNLEEALIIANRRDSETPEDARLERVLGLIHDRYDNLDKAELHYRTAIQLDRSDKQSMFALGDVYRRSKKPMQAQRQLRTLLEQDPDHEPARELLALALLEDGKRDAARQEYVQLEKQTRKETTRVRCRILLDPELRDNPEKRRELLLKAMEVSGEDAPAWSAMAETYEDTDPQKARECFVKAAALEPNDLESLVGILRADQYELKFDLVAKGLEEMLQCRPNHHVWRRMLIGMYGLTEQFDRAIAIADQQDQRTDLEVPRQAEYREALIEALREAGRRDEAISRLQGWSASDGDGAEWTQRLALEYMRQRKYAEAVRIYESLYARVPDNRAIRDRMLDALQQNNQAARAEQYIVQWFAEDPMNDRLVLALGNVISRAGRVDESIALLNSWLLKTERREMFQDLMVSELAAAARHDDCAQLLGELIDELFAIVRVGGDINRLPPEEHLTDERRSRRPNEPFALDRLHERLEFLRLRRIVALGNAGRFRDAQQVIDQLMENNPDPEQRLRLLYSQATLSRLRGDAEEADTAMEQVLAMRQQDESISNDLSYAWIDRGVRLDEAEKLIRFSLGRIPRQAAYLDTYGWLLYKKGEFEGAATWLSRANRVRGGDDPVIFDHLGDTYWRLGRKDDAVAQWRIAVDLVKDRTEAELTNDDERRVKKSTHQKIEDVAKPEGPRIAPVGGEPRKDPAP